MNNNEKSVNNEKMTAPMAVSRITFDEATGTLTLKLTSEEEIAEDERLIKQRAESNEETSL